MKQQNVTIDAETADRLDAYAARAGHRNRLEALRVLLMQASTRHDHPPDVQGGCAGTLTYLYDPRDATLSAWVRRWRGLHPALVIATAHSHLCEGQCLETVMLRGEAAEARVFAQALMAMRGVGCARLHLVPVDAAAQPGPLAGAPAPSRWLQ